MINRDLLDKIRDFNFWHKEQETGLKRKELKEVLKFVDDREFVLAINGVRRAGKTYLSKQILKEKLKEVKPEQTLYINFEDPTLEPYLNPESLKDLYESYRYFLNKKDFAYIVLDEIHNVPRWEKWVRIMLEKKEKVKFIITGSSSKLFKNEFARLLTGRTITFHLFPLSFKNFLDFKNYQIKKYQSYDSLSPFIIEYLQYGGFPLIVLEKDETKKNLYLKELFNDILVKDIITKGNW
jgi:predicted AAA+ superfamily ATPase